MLIILTLPMASPWRMSSLQPSFLPELMGQVVPLSTDKFLIKPLFKFSKVHEAIPPQPSRAVRVPSYHFQNCMRVLRMKHNPAVAIGVIRCIFHPLIGKRYSNFR